VTEEYLLSGGLSELERLQLQARVWNPFGETLLEPWREQLLGARVLDVGCGALGWLPVLTGVVGPHGSVTGTDLDEGLLASARQWVEEEGITNVRLVADDLFDSRLEPGFDLVHARFQLAPLGRVEQQLDSYRRLLRDGGLLVLEDPDPASWHFNPPAEAAERLIALILEAFEAANGNFSVGRDLATLLGANAHVAAHVLALPHGHPYLRLPLQFSASLRPRLLQLADEAQLDELEAAAERELADPARWGTTFTLIQAVAAV
jgi:SAM-dependent methyltransferase